MMTELKAIPSKEFLPELKERVAKKEISQEEIFTAWESQPAAEMITGYKKVKFDNFAKED